MPGYVFRVKRDLTTSFRSLAFVLGTLVGVGKRRLQSGTRWIGEDVMLRTVVVAGLWLVSTAALAESLWLESATALADKKSDCLNSKDHYLRIDACSAMIQRNPKDVVAYHNRGDAYGLMGDIDRAIADYTKAIDLNPNYAPAYYSRGRAYTRKGDYIRAVADVTKAGELTRKVRPGKQKGAARPSEDSWWAWAMSKLTN
jgi:tetratricopeptide (TPR) repeat protein